MQRNHHQELNENEGDLDLESTNSWSAPRPFAHRAVSSTTRVRTRSFDESLAVIRSEKKQVFCCGALLGMFLTGCLFATIVEDVTFQPELMNYARIDFGRNPNAALYLVPSPYNDSDTSFPDARQLCIFSRSPASSSPYFEIEFIAKAARERYCIYHGYTCYHIDSTNVFKALQERIHEYLTRENKKCEYLLWMEPTSIILRPTIRFQEFVSQMSTFPMNLSIDFVKYSTDTAFNPDEGGINLFPGGSSIPGSSQNSGADMLISTFDKEQSHPAFDASAFIVRSCQFLDRVFEYASGKAYSKWLADPYKESAALSDVLLSLTPKDKYLKKILYVRDQLQTSNTSDTNSLLFDLKPTCTDAKVDKSSTCYQHAVNIFLDSLRMVE